MGEPQVDGDAAALFFFQAVGVDAGERFDQGGLAVVDVAGGADDDVLHAACYSVKVLAWFSSAGPGGRLAGLLRAHDCRRDSLSRRPPAANWASAPPISILKPLAGAEDGLEENLRIFFRAALPGVRNPVRGAQRRTTRPIAVVERLRARYPAVPSRLIVTGEPPYPNAKVYSLDRMLAAARHDLVVMADSDIRVTPDMLSALAAEFADRKLGLATCPYRVVPGRSFWSTLEAIGLNTEFLGRRAGGAHAGGHEVRARPDHRRAPRDAARRSAASTP